MEKLLSNKYMKFIVGFLVSLSGAFLSFQLMIKRYDRDLILITMIISFFSFLYLYYKTINYVISNTKKNYLLAIFLAILGAIVFYKVYQLKGIPAKKWFKKSRIQPMRLKYFYASIISYYYLALYVGFKIRDWVKRFIKSLTSYDKKVYIVSSIIWFFIIVIAYSITKNFYTYMDRVYSLDSGWNFNYSYKSIIYTDIRHPFLNVFTFPIYAIIDFIVSLFVQGNMAVRVDAIVMQIIHSQLFIIMAIQLRRITKNKVVPIVFLLSFSTLLFSLFFEKYQICIFLSFIYISDYFIYKKDNSTALICAAGCMPTSAYLGILELFKKYSIKDKIFNCLKIINVFIVTMICTGRLYFFKYGFTELKNTKEQYTIGDFTIKQKVISTTEMFHGVLVAPPSHIENGENYKYNHMVGKFYTWNNVLDHFEIISIIIVLLCMIGLFIKRKDLFYRICFLWILLAIGLFVMFNWSIFESPLFSVYFSWAIIPLLVVGIDYIIKLFKFNHIAFYVILLSLITIINVSTLYDACKFLWGVKL